MQQTILTMNPVADWIKNIIDHAIHGKPRPPPPAADDEDGNDSSTPLIASLASALRGDLVYPCPGGGGSAEPRVDDDAYSGLTAAAVLAPPPCRDPTLRQKRRAGLRREMLGDRKLRVARLLMETATAGRMLPPQRRGDEAAGVAGAGTERGHLQQQQQTAVSVRKARRLLTLSTGVFGRRRPGGRRAGTGGGGGGGGSSSGLSSQRPRPPLIFKEDVLPLIRPAYSLLGEALLGDAGLARRLAPEAVAVASALAVAGLDYTLAGREGRADSERRAAWCFAEVVVLAVSTHLGMVLASVRPVAPVDGGGGGGGGDDGSGLAELGPCESRLEQLLESLSAWECHGGVGRGWPHSSLPAGVENSSLARAEGGGRGGVPGPETEGGRPGAEESSRIVEDGIPLPQLLKEVENMATDLRHAGAVGETGEEMRRLLDNALAPRLEACRAYFQQPGGGGVKGAG